MSAREYPDRPLVAVGVAVLWQGAVLLIRRGRAPAAGVWSLPGGAQKLGETAEAAARRELAEETGVSVGTLHLAAVVDSIHCDAVGRILYHYTIIDYAAGFVSGTPRPGGDATAARFVAMEAVAGLGVSEAVLGVIERARKNVLF